MNARQNFATDAGAYTEAIATSAKKLMVPGAELDPLNGSNFEEAIGNELAEMGSTLVARLAAALRAGEPVNQILADVSHDYWLHLATKRAEKDHADAVRQEAEDRADALWQAHQEARQAAYDRCAA